MKDTILIYSGGLDSTAALYTYKDRIALAVTFLYGSKHNKYERLCAEENCKLLGIEHLVIDMSFLGEHLKSSLTTDEEIPEGRYDEEKMKSTVVPFRNGIMLSIATGIAESRNLQNVMIASHSGDHAIYPDCSEDFNYYMDFAMIYGTYNSIELVRPFENLDKKEVAQIGIENGMDPDKTYSCYKGVLPQCGVCSTCRERDWALGLREEP